MEEMVRGERAEPRTPSSGGAEVSTSLRRERRKLGWAGLELLSGVGRRRPRNAEGRAWEEEDSPESGSAAVAGARRVWGRFSLRSGSVLVVGSVGEELAERRFRFREGVPRSLGELVADLRFGRRGEAGSSLIFLALSIAFHASISSVDSGSGRSGGAGRGREAVVMGLLSWSRSSNAGAVTRKRCAAPCRSATRSLCIHSRCCWLCARVLCSTCATVGPSSTNGKSRSMLSLSHTVCQTRAQLASIT